MLSKLQQPSASLPVAPIGCRWKEGRTYQSYRMLCNETGDLFEIDISQMPRARELMERWWKANDELNLEKEFGPFPGWPDEKPTSPQERISNAIDKVDSGELTGEQALESLTPDGKMPMSGKELTKFAHLLLDEVVNGRMTQERANSELDRYVVVPC